MKIKSTLIAISTFTLLACGAPAGQDQEENTNDPTGKNDPQVNSEFDTDQSGTIEDAANDPELAGHTITSQIDVAISDLAEEATTSSNGTGLHLASLEFTGEMLRHRECNEVEDTAVVDITRSFEGKWSFEGPFRKGNTNVSFSGERKRTWSKDADAIKCHESGLYAEIPIADMQGVNLAVKFDRIKTRTSSLTNKAKDRTVERSMKLEARGTRNIKWDSITEGEDGYEIEKTISSSVQRKLQVANMAGELLLIENDVSTVEESPLKTTLIRDLTTLAPLSRTIHSGMVAATDKNGGRIETSFNEVTWSFEGGCMAVSGTISGAVYKPGENDPAKTFTIDFSTDEKTISFDDGTSYDYAPEGCDLDKVSSVKDVADPSDVKADAADTDDMNALESDQPNADTTDAADA